MYGRVTVKSIVQAKKKKKKYLNEAADENVSLAAILVPINFVCFHRFIAFQLKIKLFLVTKLYIGRERRAVFYVFN